MEALSSLWGARSYLPYSAQRWFYKDKFVPNPSKKYYAQQAKKRESLMARYPKRRSYKSKKRGRRSVARPRLASQLKGVGWQEVKFIDHSLTGVATTQDSAALIDEDLLKIVQGVGQSQRIGRRVRLMSVEHSIILRLDGLSGDDLSAAFQQVRLYSVKDTSAVGGATPPLTDILQGGPVAGTINYPNMRFEGRFKKLKDFTRNFNVTAAATEITGSTIDSLPRQMVIKWRTNMRGCLVEYSGATGVVAERTLNNIVTFLMFANAAQTNWHYHARVHYQG